MRLSSTELTLLAADINMGGNDITEVSQLIGVSGGLAVSNLDTINPGSRILNATAGNVIVRWNGDGNGDGNRHFEWRRSASFGVLELYGIAANGTATLAMSIADSGAVTIPNLT